MIITKKRKGENREFCVWKSLAKCLLERARKRCENNMNVELTGMDVTKGDEWQGLGSRQTVFLYLRSCIMFRVLLP
jgi:hypothetical protein